MISVAMATYNGEQFLAQQLASLASQILLPGELVIRDDASTDGTVEAARAFASTAPFPVRIAVNPVNLGSTATFERAIADCHGNAIALCDQDDIWKPQKLARIQDALAGGCGFVFSDGEIVDTKGIASGSRLWQSLGFTPREQRRFRANPFVSLLQRNRITGATMAFRASLRDRLLPIPTEWVHDAWIALILAATEPCDMIEEPLVQYRQHEGQQIGAARRTVADELRAANRVNEETFRKLHDQFAQVGERLGHVPPALREKLSHLERRHRLRQGWRTPRVLRELATGRYFRYSRGWASVAQDLFLA